MKGKFRFSMPTGWNGNAGHLWYLLIVPAYLAGFFLVERLIPSGSAYWVSYLPIDDWIPFCEWFVIPYVLWYPFLAGIGVYTLLKEPEEFKKYMTFIGVSFMSALVIFVLFPTGQELRPAVMERDNVLTQLIQAIYAADTNTNVLPSLHAVGSIGVVCSVFHCKGLKRPLWRIGSVVLAVLILAATVFTKQHSILDTLVAIPYAALVYGIVYHGLYRRKVHEETTI
ncbi:MAG: phosphatase PAP2 family protein [Clostridia bacterium]|nr:phosphatase PAP2 family protein [Clostridia bacterium]